MRDLGVYIHIPYCLQKCRYCDFTSGKICDASLSPDDYTNKVCLEIVEAAHDKAIGQNILVNSIYFGGGTPTCIGTDLIGRILLCIKQNFQIDENAEISIEANPETITLKKAQNLRFLGFNRISMGVQSLDDNILQIMGRVHTSSKALEAFHYLRQAGFDSINLDLMFGVPGQSFDVWKRTLDDTINLNPEHISFYSLQLEEGTPFYEDYRSGKIDIPGWDENRRMYHYAVKALKAAGYHHYEVSNAAKPGKECRHNLKYWTMEEYIGFGTSAHSFIDNKRFFNTDEYDYCKVCEEDNSSPSLTTDWLFTGLRLIDGTDFGQEIIDHYSDIIDQLVSEGYIIKEGTRLRFSKLGLDNTNNVLERFINY